jgi:tetratricopeptide (TPR) repeat protein
MIDSKRDGRETEVSGGKLSRMQSGILGAVCMLVIGIYACMVQSGVLESLSLNAADAYYNLLVQGFRAGQLNVKKEVPPGLAQLADPYDPAANFLYRAPQLHDLSYYKGRLYLYFGVTPALILFWPYAWLTGGYLFHRQAVVIFCAIGFLTSVGLLRALWRRYFTGVGIGVIAACALALGLATGVPMLLPQADVYEVAISCGYMLTMLALGALWCALHEPERTHQWLAAASTAYGLAVGARPSLVFGGIILLVPVVQAWRERKRFGALLAAAAIPIGLIGLGLMLYNTRRFDNPFEFGMRYQLAGERLVTKQLFSLHNVWFNFRLYFLELARWGARFPFVREIVVSSAPTGHGNVVEPFGILINIPVVWLALAVPLAWQSWSGLAGSTLRWFVTTGSLLFGICALTNCLFTATNFRYEVDFLPVLLLLAMVGILGLERVLVGRPIWRRAARWGWGLLLSLSVTFNLLASVEHRAATHNNEGIALAQLGRMQEAIGRFEQALRVKPDYAEAHYNLGLVLGQTDRPQEAIRQYERALRIKPGDVAVHCNLAITLAQVGRIQEAIAHWEQALRIKPDSAEVHFDLGQAFEQTGKLREAIGQYEQALKLRPDYAEARNMLARLRSVE